MMSWRYPRVPRHSYRLERLGRGSVDFTPTSFLTPRRFQSSVTATNETSQAPRRARHSQILDQDISSTIKVDGLIRSVRKQKKIAFARLNDGSTLEPIQAVFPDPALAKDITNGSYVSLIGKWVQSPGAGQSHELHVDEVVELGQSNSLEHPIQKHAMAADYLRTIPHLRMRTAFQSCILRTRSALLSIIANHFSQGFGENRLPVYQVHPPLITSSDCEGAGEVFTVTPKSSQPVPLPPEANKETQAERLYFRDTKYLTVSSQLHLEAYAAELGDVYALSPTFRAEESDTPRHLAEFYMLEAEHRDVTFDELLKGVNKLVSDIANRIQNHRVADELQKYYSDHKHRDADSDEADLPDRWNRLAGEYQIITYTEAISELEKASEAKGDKLFARKPRWDQGLQLEHERWVVENLGNGFPIFVTHYPKHIKPFYMLPSTENVTAADEYQQNSGGRGETVACFDLLLPMGYCEVAGGSMREHRLENLIDNMRNKGLIKKTIPSKNDEYPFLNPDETLGSLKWYADLRRFGTSRHGGYGLGFDRLLAYLTGVANVRDVVAFPRTWGRADC
ncbi:asparagine-tRNA ligase [Exophiala mesophila]|uniref:asparagine--tRNA ligase n=1 Tax=Exophiala mesophila TaxID=212818 RepID=A0A0D1ZRR7_EXOME|nr:asparagine-tRNA ligase [Exophiala mesophila]KIV96649.1 asparagine-tRNA ligase [Exophiala mesophila]